MIKATLTVVRGPNRGARYTLEGEGARVLGREQNCAIRIVDRGLSRQHLKLERVGGQFVVTDLQSSNGTFVNGKQVQEHTLRDGDVITVGETELAFSVREGEKDSALVDLVSDLFDATTTQVKRRFAGAAETGILRPAGEGEDQADAYRKAHERLKVLYEVGNVINAEGDLDHLFNLVIDAILKVTRAERGFIVMKEGSSYRPVVRRVPGGGKGRSSISNTILKESLENGLSVLSVDAMNDDRFKSGESVITGRVGSVMCVPVEFHDKVLGAIYVDSSLRRAAFTEEELELMTAVGKEAGGAIHRAQLVRDRDELFLGCVKALVTAIDAKDAYTHGHSERVAYYSVQLAEAMELPAPEVEKVRLSALLHDIGKIGVPERILNKPGRLTEQEYKVIMRHPCIGAEMLAHIRNIEGIIGGVKHHHEKWDGTGFPDGLAGEGIPLIARVVAVADAFDAMTSHRSYRRGLPMELVLEEFKRYAGRQFDARCAGVLVELASTGRFKMHESASVDLFDRGQIPAS
ncbi:MAG: HD domain-containing protein [Planctomycetes bacterium]|nr:HD domain-containing protein [Planctomycetota bacterium]